MTETTPGLEFGVTFRLEHPPERLSALMQAADAAGFEHGWLFDNPIAAMEPYPLLALCASSTSRIRLGTCVTNPLSRHPSVTASALATLDLISDGRMELGIGRGDSAVRLIGGAPSDLASFEWATTTIRTLVEGGEVDIDGVAVSLPWAQPRRLPVWIAGYGPRIIEIAARIADGVVLQLGDPTLLAILIRHLRECEARAGRPEGAVKVMVALPAHVGDRATGIERTVWYPRFLRHHLETVVRHWADELPRGYAEAYLAGDSEADLRAEASATCLIGDPADHLERIDALRMLGVDQVNLYLMDGGQDEVIAAYAADILPVVPRGSLVASGRPA
jgi:alkanesulfonate monooxygenase SsuD/methylene tetrahydromethanopterin reductase-like flavin-dependent oxidoreductase (luciferase family)